MLSYAEDNEDTFPVHHDWPTFGGEQGNLFPNNPGWNPTNRPLNAYSSRAVFQCPRDKGDSHAGLDSVWVAFGNSYIVQYAVNSFRIKYVTTKLAPGHGPPVKATTVDKTANKILSGDWPLHANRLVTDPRTQWHSRKGMRALNIVFADGHAELFSFPQTYVWAEEFVPVDSNYLWW